jgi:hypothetical protein
MIRVLKAIGIVTAREILRDLFQPLYHPLYLLCPYSRFFLCKFLQFFQTLRNGKYKN